MVVLVAGCGRPATPLPTDSLTVPPPQAARPGWWNDAVFYEVFVRSFADSTTGPLANDGIGDLQGLIERLDYLNDGNPATNTDLGVTGIWLMPIMQSPSYHGYDITDYYTVEQDYGTNQDFKRLVAEAHKRGIKVIIDLVLNHTSSEHPWFIQAGDRNSPYRDWYIWSDTDPGYKGPWGQTVWHRRGDEYYYGIFWEGMPDLNYKTPAVTEEMLNVTRFWLQEMGADGYRLDAIRHLIEAGKIQENTPATHEWLRQFNQVYKGVNPDAVTVGEIWTDSKTVSTYIGDQLDLAFEFDLAQAILTSARTGLARAVGEAHNVALSSFPPNQYATFITNHDQERVMSQLYGRTDMARVAATLLLTGPGVPFIYYGEEIGMTGRKPDEKIRTPMQWTAGAGAGAGFSPHEPWQAVNNDYVTVNVQAQNADPDSLLNLYRTLIHIRNAHPALRQGDMARVETGHVGVYAFLRQTDNEQVLVLINLSNETVNEYALKVSASKLSGSLKAIELLNSVEATAPRLKGQGGFDDYRPIKELSPRTGYVLWFAP